MSVQVKSRRGQPLVVYVLLIVGWIGIRSFFWDSPLPERLTLAHVEASESVPIGMVSPSDFAGGRNETQMKPETEAAVQPGVGAEDWYVAPSLVPIEGNDLTPIESATGPVPVLPEIEFADGQAAAGHQILWMAAMAQLPVPRDLVNSSEPGRLVAANPWLPLAKEPGLKRWSLDAWVFLRQNSGAATRTAALRPSYGKSQQGAVLRYRVAEANGLQPSLYGRYTQALAGAREVDVAAGLVAKPIPRLPLWAHAEMRATRVNGATKWRPAAFVTTGGERQLPYGVKVRAYGQAGYVGGDFATVFADGQIVADRAVANFDLGKATEATLHVGAGVWGGAQKGAERLDIGPSANVVVPVGDAPVRLSVDYRLRVTGDAEPDSGVAFTLSTGF